MAHIQLMLLQLGRVKLLPLLLLLLPLQLLPAQALQRLLLCFIPFLSLPLSLQLRLVSQLDSPMHLLASMLLVRLHPRVTLHDATPMRGGQQASRSCSLALERTIDGPISCLPHIAFRQAAGSTVACLRA